LNKPGIADQLLFLSRRTASWMRLRAGQSIIELALLSRPGATSGATNRQGLLLRFHDSILQYRPLTTLVNCDQSALGT
jgi:hypothetical protein